MRWFLQVMSGQMRMRLAYPWGFWVSLSLELFVVASINWYLWSAVLASRGGADFPGYTLRTLVLYSLITSILRKVQVNSDQFGGLGDDIYSGSLNKYLVYPVSYFGFRYAMHLGGSLVSFCQSFLALLLFWVVFALQDIQLPGMTSLLQFLVLVFLGVSLRFLINAVLQTLAFWFDQVWSLLVLFNFLIQLLGGQLIPMDLYPDWARNLLFYTPFPLLAAWPAEALLGKMSWTGFFQGCGMACLWLVVFNGIARFSFNRGVRNYSGIGA
ncbi:ABC transporter permease [Oligoflexus tunisiensis]|uniref:ABC transporter permease n=1 Tax=Oligoflexus tunisiensis TaxID=708132 RepID=UPI00114CDE8C|nr:ABC-2 family transporter protein [Oligoflexus tunisiensis]